MEGLVLLLAEFLWLPLAAAVAVIVDVAVLAMDLVAHLAGYLIGRVARRHVSISEPAPVARRLRIPWRPLTRWIGFAAVVVFGLLLAAVAVINAFFFETIVRAQLSGVEKKTGIAVTFDSVRGSLWAGRVELNGVKIRRLQGDVSRFDLAANTFHIDLSTVDLLWLNPVFKEVEVRGLRGTYDRLEQPEPVRPRRSFRLDRLIVADAVIQVADHTRRRGVFKTELQIDSLVAQPLRSEWAVFDVLFRSNATGKIGGCGFSIASDEISAGRQTRWKGDGLPIELAAAYIGGPLEWIQSGKMDVDVTDRWQVGERAEIDMHWAFVLRDVQAEVPADAPRSVQAVARPAVAFLNRHRGRLPLDFEVTIDRERFRFAASPETVDFGRIVADAMTLELGRLAGIRPEAIKAAAAENWEHFRAFLDRRRK